MRHSGTRQAEIRILRWHKSAKHAEGDLTEDQSLAIQYSRHHCKDDSNNNVLLFSSFQKPKLVPDELSVGVPNEKSEKENILKVPLL